MCQWKFFVFTYSANTSARIAFIAAVMSLVAACVRSVRVSNGASRLCKSSMVFFELGLFIVMLHRLPAFPFCLVTRAVGYPPYRLGVAVELASRAQAVGDLITPDGFLHLRTK